MKFKSFTTFDAKIIAIDPRLPPITDFNQTGQNALLLWSTPDLKAVTIHTRRIAVITKKIIVLAFPNLYSDGRINSAGVAIEI
jgi:hypothetical protein